MSIANEEASGSPTGDDVAAARHHIRPSRWIGTIIILYFAVQFVVFLVGNPRFEWHIVWKYFTAGSVLTGLGITLMLTVIAMLIGIVLGTIAALLLLGDFLAGRLAAKAYLWIFRGTPLMIQLIFWYNLAYLIPNITIGLPFMDPFFSWKANAIISPSLAAILGLGLAEGAYMTEIVRAGLMSVDVRQHDAARTIGMTPFQAFFRIIFPQAMRFIVPPTGNQIISMLKATALVSVISMNELLFSVQSIYNRTYEIVPCLMVAVIWYLIVITILYFFQMRLERHYARGHSKIAEVNKPQPGATL